MSHSHVGVEWQPPFESWRVSNDGLVHLGAFFEKLTPYQDLGCALHGEVLTLCRESLVFVAVDLSNTGAMLGIGRLVVHKATPRYGEIHDCVVETTARKHGVGRQLMDKLINQARMFRLSYVGLRVKAKRDDFIRLCEKCGFVRIQAADPADPESHHVYRLDLTLGGVH